jgi:NAD+ diphosphatase
MLSKNDLKDLQFNPNVAEIGNHKQILFLFDENYQIYLAKDDDDFTVPTCSDFDLLNLVDEISIGYLGDYRCTAAIVKEMSDERVEPFNLREPLYFFNELYSMFSRAKILLHWHHRSKFCSKCGGPTIMSKAEICKICESCGELYFPVVAPAAITIIRKGDKILLAHNNKFTKGFYSIIAGFTEAGESFEECVEREIFEEVGLKVKNIRYFGNQSWPFHNSHMVGFIAEYESGEITPDGHEIILADWFSIDELPTIPSKLSISRKLMDFVIEQIKNDQSK